jgi:hypothetical protein
MNEKIDPKLVKEFFDYNKETGTLYWKERDRKWFNHDKYHYTWNKKFAGKRAGRTKTNKYMEVGIFNRLYGYHRVVWAWVHGEWPENFIDHIDGNPSNNRIQNLRKVTQLQNLKNINKNKGDIPLIGVHKKGNRFIARIRDNYERINLGSFGTPEEAHAAYCAKAKELFGEYTNFGL